MKQDLSLLDALQLKKTKFGGFELQICFSETDQISIPTDLYVFANQFAKTSYQNILPKIMSGETLQKLWTKQDLTLLNQAKRNLIKSYIINKTFRHHQISIMPLVPEEQQLYRDLLKKETDLKKLTGTIDICAINQYIASLQTPAKLKPWFQYYNIDYKKQVKKVIFKMLQYCVTNGRFIRSIKTIQKCKQLQEILEKRADDIKVINGPAESGKSTSVINYIKKIHQKNHDAKFAICTLSNTIGLMFQTKLAEFGITIDMFSITKATLGYSTRTQMKQKLVGYDIVVIDEFSQWGIAQLDTLGNIFNCNQHAKIFIMGDVHQIPTFLSSGSLLFSFLNYFSGRKNSAGEPICETKKQLYRFQDEQEALMKKILTNDTNFKLQICDYKPSYLKDVDCVITGSNKHVKMLNEQMINQVFKVNAKSRNMFEVILECQNNFNDTQKHVQLIANTTGQFGKKKVYCNERFEVKRVNLLKRKLTCQSKVQKTKEIEINEWDLKTGKFSFGYSITVNKSQGLNWTRTCVFMNKQDGNLFTHNALYVALSRSKMNVILLSNEENGYDKITSDDLIKIIKNKNYSYDYQNLLDLAFTNDPGYIEYYEKFPKKS